VRRRLAALLLLLLLGAGPALARELPEARPERVGLSSERLDRLRAVLSDAVARGQLAGAVGLIARRGRIAFFESFGARDREQGAPMQRDAIFRIASMSKPITSVATLVLAEEGRFLLSDPVSRFLPELGRPEVGVERRDPKTGKVSLERVPAEREITIQDLLRHTSGLTYGFFDDSAVDKLYLERGVMSRDQDLAETVAKLGKLPLKHQPGAIWEYSVSVDVLARLVEVVSGLPFDRFLRERLFGPLDMRDTDFNVPAAELPRVAALYEPDGNGGIRPLPPQGVQDLSQPVRYFSGGGGLVSTARDYARFAQALLEGGELDGERVLGRKTVELMRSDHLGTIPFPRHPGYGFGLGFAVRTAPGLAPLPSSVGEYHWGGYYGTGFWIDPAEEMIGVFMMQLPRSPRNFDAEFKALAYQAIAD
jgi:CubicO group peptidase (beta-lactamase class C family)